MPLKARLLRREVLPFLASDLLHLLLLIFFPVIVLGLPLWLGQ